MLIWKPGNKKWHHDGVITKTMAKFGPPRNQTVYISYHSKGIDDSQKCSFYWIWRTVSNVMGILVKIWLFSRCPLPQYAHVTWPKMPHCVKRYGHFGQNLALFTMSTPPICSCHVAQDANFETFYFVLILDLTLSYLGGGGKIRPPPVFLHHPKTAQGTKLNLSDFKDTTLRHLLQVKPVRYILSCCHGNKITKGTSQNFAPKKSEKSAICKDIELKFGIEKFGPLSSKSNIKSMLSKFCCVI